MKPSPPGALHPPGSAGKGFTQVWNSFIRDEGLSGEAKALGLLYASFANAKREAYPGLPILQRLTGWGRDVVQRARSELRKRGLLERVAMRNYAGQFKGARFRVSDQNLARRPPEKPSDGDSGARTNRPPGS